MALPYLEIFLGLFVVYLVYSALTHMDARYPIGAALLMLVAAAVADAANSVDLANTLAEYVFLLLAGGVLLLLVDHLRSTPHPSPAGSDSEGSLGPEGVPAEPSREGDTAPNQGLDRVEEQLVPLVDAAGHDDNQHKEGRDSDRQDRERPDR